MEAAAGAQTVLITISGDLDLDTIDLTRQHIRHALSNISPTRIVLDLSQVTFMGSIGLALLLELRDTATAAGTALVLRGAKRRIIARPLEVTGLIHLFVLE